MKQLTKFQIFPRREIPTGYVISLSTGTSSLLHQITPEDLELLKELLPAMEEVIGASEPEPIP